MTPRLALRIVMDTGALAIWSVAHLLVYVMMAGFLIGLPLAIIDLILPGSPLGIQAWARDNPGAGAPR